MLRIGLLTGKKLSGFRHRTLKPILSDNLFSIKVAIINNRPKTSPIKKLKKHIKLGRGGYVIVMAIQSFFSKKFKGKDTKEFCRENGIEIIETINPYSTDTIEEIRKHNLDILLLIDGYSIIKEQLINITPLGVLSYHHGDMRKYRGQPPALWELYNNEKQMGVTVQVLAVGLDCGIPVQEKVITINNGDSLKQLKKRAYRESESMMYDALKIISNKNFIHPKIESFGKVYTLPNLSQWISLNIKVLWRKFRCLFS